MHNSQETSHVMSTCGRMITEYHGSPESKGMLKAFFLTLQVTHYLSCGMTKSVKTLLRQLQDCIQNLTTQEGEIDGVTLALWILGLGLFEQNLVFPCPYNPLNWAFQCITSV